MSAEKLISRLIKKSGLQNAETPPDAEQWCRFKNSLHDLVTEFRERQAIAENALAVSTAEMERLYEELRLKSESQFKDDRIFLTTIVESLPAAFYCKDVKNEFRYVLWNQSATRIFGITSTNVLGRSDEDLYGKDEAAHRRALDLKASLQDGIFSTPDEEIIRDERIFYIRTHRVLVRGVDGCPRFLLGLSEDITTERQARESVIQSAKLASLGEMAGGIAHEINNPLSIILGKADILATLLEDEINDRPQLISIAKSIMDTADRIDVIVQGMRTFSRRSDDDSMVEEVVQDVIKSTMDLCSARFRNHDVDLKIDVPEEPIYVACRRVQIGQVLMNLLGNALDAVENLDDKWVEIHLKIDESRDNVILVVENSGERIPNHVRLKMFEPFFTTKDVGKGTGLGLSISRNIIGGHGGIIKYDETCDHPKFIISLPASRSMKLPEQKAVG